ncbi:hypothetical protein D3C71_1398330 [compost metagenome]
MIFSHGNLADATACGLQRNVGISVSGWQAEAENAFGFVPPIDKLTTKRADGFHRCIVVTQDQSVECGFGDDEDRVSTRPDKGVVYPFGNLGVCLLHRNEEVLKVLNQGRGEGCITAFHVVAEDQGLLREIPW